MDEGDGGRGRGGLGGEQRRVGELRRGGARYGARALHLRLPLRPQLPQLLQPPAGAIGGFQTVILVSNYKLFKF